jgi:hypothetical protein
MEAIRIETTVQADGVLSLSGLPFAAGQQVEVIVLESAAQATTTETTSFDKTSIHPFQGQPGVYLQDPFAPAVPEEDWEALR